MGFNCDFDSVELRLKLLFCAEKTMIFTSSATSINASKSNPKTPAAPLKSTIYPRLIFGNSVALSDC